MPHVLLLAVATFVGFGLCANASGDARAAEARFGEADIAGSTVIQNVAKKRRIRIQAFGSRTVRATPGLDRVTVSWPARANATGYTVVWAPYSKTLPATPAGCTSPCKRRFTRARSVVLSAKDLTTYGRIVSSASGNYTRFKVFAHRGKLLRATGLAAWIGPAWSADVNWLPGAHAAMPRSLPPAPGLRTAITSFNVLSASATGVPSWSVRAPRVVDQIDGSGSSIVATQENSNSANGVASGRAQYVDLADRLRPHGWSLADDRNWDRVSNPSQASSASSQATRIYYRSDVWNQADRGALMTHVPFGGKTSGVNVDRWVSWVKLRNAADPSVQTCVVNAHLLTNVGSSVRASADHRNAEIAQILAELNSTTSALRRVGVRLGQACAGVPVIFAGDLNAAQAHAPYGNQPQAKMIQNGFVDTKNAPTRVYTRFSGTGAISAWHATWGTQIDYILAKGVGGAVSFKVNAVTPSRAGSDHYPVTAVVNVPAG